jgi:predicted permease
MLGDLRLAIRGLRKTPGFAVAAVVSLALAIGANTAIFSVANGLLLKPLPYHDAQRLVTLWNTSPGLGITQDWFSTAQYFDIRSGHGGFEQIAIAIGGDYNLNGTGEPERIGVTRMSSNLLPMLGARAAMGRLLQASDDLPGAGAAPAVLTHGAWMRRFGGNPATLGRQITLNGDPFTIVGILPRDFRLPHEVLPTLRGVEDAEVLLALPLEASAAAVRGREDYNVMGKLKRGVTTPQAQTEMDALTARLRREHPDVYPPNGGLRFSIVPLLEQVAGETRRPLYILTGAVGLVLLIACSNLASLLLARALGRRREMALRATLGAGRWRLVRQLLTESVALALAGGAAGVLLAAWMLRAIRLAGPAGIPRLDSIEIDMRVLAFTLATSVAAGIIFGLAPAWGASRLDLSAALKEGGWGAAASGSLWGRGNRLRRALVAGELALSVVLLIGAGLLVRSFARLLEVPPGFNASSVMTMGITMSGRQYASGQVVRKTYRRLWERLDRIPGVTASGATNALPLSQMFDWGPITIEGRVPPPGENFINADERIVAWKYFEAMRIPLKAGRLFTEHDTADAARVAVIDERMAREYWPNGDAVGHRFRLGGAGSTNPWVTVVGVVGRVKQYSLDADDRIALYLPHEQFTARAMNLTIRGAGDAGALAAAIRGELRVIDPELPAYQARTMEDRVWASLARRRFALGLLAGFAVLALALAAVGVYGVMAYLVSQGTREIGIRMALGATPEGVAGLVIRRGMGLALGGVAAGLAAAALLARVMRSMLFGVGEWDATTFGATAAVLGAVALAACWVPARRASRVQVITALRTE